MQSGFKKQTVATENNQKFGLCMINLRVAVKAQVASSRGQIILIKQSNPALVTHPVNSKIGTGAGRPVKSAVQTSLCLNVIWMSKNKDQAHSIIDHLQMYLDRGKISLFASADAFY